jgi:hypothetical protein
MKPEFRLAAVVYPDATRIVVPRISPFASRGSALTVQVHSVSCVGITIAALAVVGVATDGSLIRAGAAQNLRGFAAETGRAWSD